MPRPYAAEFRRRALDLLQTGRSVRDVAASWASPSPVCTTGSRGIWLTAASSRRPHNRLNHAAARARIAELETEVKILRKAAAAVEQVVPPKARIVLVAELVVEDVPVKQACLFLGVSRSCRVPERSHGA